MNKEEFDFEVKLHKLRMKEIATRRKAEEDMENLKFDHQLQLQRIKSAEIRKNIMGKKDFSFDGYP